MEVLDRLRAARARCDLDGVRPLIGAGVRRLRSAGIQLSDRRAVRSQALVAAAAALDGRRRATAADLWPLPLVVPTAEGQPVARGALVAWRELEATWTCHQLARSPVSLAAVVAIPPDAFNAELRVELWRWDLPSMRLAVRHRIEVPDHAVGVHLLADVTSIWERVGAEPLAHAVVSPGGQQATSLEASDQLRSSGDHLARRRQGGAVTITAGHGGPEVAAATVDRDRWGMRSHAGRIAIWDDTGRLATVDTVDRRLVSVVRITS
jgi:hypothetical protein